MTIASETNRWAYTGDGSTTGFAYTNRIFASSDLQVFLDAVLQTEATHYTVSGVGSGSGGDVQFLSAPANASSVVVVRDVPATQGTDLPIGGAFPSTTVEDSFDKLTVLVQQNADKIARALVLAESDTGSIGTLPDTATRASKYLAFDGAGNPAAGASLADQTVSHATDVFSGDAAETDFTLSTSPASATATDVFISGVRQRPTTDYTVSGATLSFTSAPPTGTDNILAIARATFAGVPSDGSVSAIKLAAGGVGTAALADDAVTAAKLAGSAVMSAKIAAGAVTEAKLAAGLVSLPSPSISGCVPSSAADTAHDIAFTAGKCVNAAGDKVLTLPAYTKQFDVAFAEGDAAGGFGAALPTSGTYYVFAITKDADGTVDYVGDTSSTGVNKPSGWTVEREVFRLMTDASANLLAFSGHALAGGAVEILLNSPILNVSSSSGNTTATLATLSVPTGKKLTALMHAGSTSGAQRVYVSSPDVNDDAPAGTVAPLYNAGSASAAEVMGEVSRRTNASGQIRYRGSHATNFIQIVTVGWIDERIV